MDLTGRTSTGSYSDSKLFVTTLSAAVARIWPDILSTLSIRAGCLPRWGEPMRRMTYGRDILLKSGLLLAMILKRLRAEGIGIINDALSRIAVHDTKFQAQLLDELARATGTPLT